ncbi:MAG TPA: DUF4437 domain-containing protein [Thermoanaerobaculia bacterium]|nr:DUF4437 domain-containing protein [Thermoanaerobaculia bacterium]
MRAAFRIVLTAFVLVVLAQSALAADAKPASKSGDKAKAAHLGLMTPDQLKWEDNPGAPEVKVAVVWGDAKKGPHGAFHKFPAGFATPLHTHSANLKAVVISGTIIEGEDGKETKLPPGSYFMQPHTVKHTTKCDAGSECVIYATANKGFDIHMVEEKK